MAFAVPTMTKAQIEEYLEETRHAILGTNRRDGAPQISPVWYLYEEGRIYIGVRVTSAKYHNMRRDPRISLCVDAGHPDSRAVMIYGSSELIEAESPWSDQINWRIERRYHDSDEATHRYQERSRDWGRRALIVMTPDKFIGQDFN